MAQDPILGEQLDIIDVSNELSSNATAIGNISSGVLTDGTLDTDYLRRDGTTTMDGSLTISGVNDLVVGGNIAITGTVDGRNVSADGSALDSHLAVGSPPIHFSEASIDHTVIQNIGTNSHDVIDAHLINNAVHYSQASISITESQISDLQTYLSNVVDDIAPVLGGALDTGGFVIKTTNSAIVPDSITIQAGSGLTDAQGAGITLLAGDSTASNYAGTVLIEAGTAAGDSLGGNIILKSGDSNTGTPGIVQIDTATATGQAELRIVANNVGRYIGLKASSTLALDITYVLPSADGSNGDVLQTDGTGNLNFASLAPPADLGEFTLVGLPSASLNPNSYALVTDANGSPPQRTIVRSNGTVWKIVAIEGATIA